MSGEHSGKPIWRANNCAPSQTNKTCRPSSITRRASLMGFLIPCTAATAPAASVFPSMIAASISTLPRLLRVEPVPALKSGLSSRTTTAASAASSARATLFEYLPTGERSFLTTFQSLRQLFVADASSTPVNDDRGPIRCRHIRRLCAEIDLVILTSVSGRLLSRSRINRPTWIHRADSVVCRPDPGRFACRWFRPPK